MRRRGIAAEIAQVGTLMLAAYGLFSLVLLAALSLDAAGFWGELARLDPPRWLRALGWLALGLALGRMLPRRQITPGRAAPRPPHLRP